MISLYNSTRRPTLPEPKWVFITPHMAEGLKSSDNRPPKPSVVKEYKRLMKEGLYRFSPHGIVLDVDGTCSDGNHRMHALAESDPAIVPGIWMLVADWKINASELRVDRGSTRSLADFYREIDRRSVEAIVCLASLVGIGYGSRRDPVEMCEVIDCFRDVTQLIIDTCQTTAKGRSSARVKVGVICASLKIGNELAAKRYRDLVLLTTERTPALESLSRQLENNNMDTCEAIARTYIAMCSNKEDRSNVRISESTIGSVRDLIRGEIQRFTAGM